MFEVIDKWTGGDVVALRVTGKVLHEDYEKLVPKLEAFIGEHGAIRCLVEIVDLEGVSLRAVWDELSFDLKHADDVTRCAVVGDRAWERWATAAAKPIFRRAEVRYFPREDLERAVEWIRDGVASG